MQALGTPIIVSLHKGIIILQFPNNLFSIFRLYLISRKIYDFFFFLSSVEEL